MVTEEREWDILPPTKTETHYYGPYFTNTRQVPYVRCQWCGKQEPRSVANSTFGAAVIACPECLAENTEDEDTVLMRVHRKLYYWPVRELFIRSHRIAVQKAIHNERKEQ